MEINNGGPAFPTENARQTGPNSYHYAGMTLRDYFAAAALMGMTANPCDVNQRRDDIAELAYKAADAMLKERNKTTNQ